MLDTDILTQVKSIFAALKSPITLVVTGDSSLEDTAKMTEFVADVASCSDKLRVEKSPAHGVAPYFTLVRDGADTGISFRGIPNGHEFTSLLLAVLNTDGQGKNLPDSALQNRIKAIQGPARLRTFVSLSCTNCPDVVQALNLVALYNEGISNETVDGAVAQDEVTDLGIQSVPTVVLGNKVLSVGRASLGELVGKLEAELGSAPETAAEPSERKFDVVIAGGGPAGAAAAIYLARKGLRTAVVAGRVGGQVNDTSDIENLISVPRTTGPSLAAALAEHMALNNIEVFANRNIISASLSGAEKSITADSRETFSAPALIIATGSSWRRLNVPGEADYIGRGVAFCTHCDGPFFAGKRVAVVGGGNSGIEAAIDLAAICEHVDVYEFLDTLKADSVLVDKVKSLPNVDIHLSSAVSEVIGDGRKLTAIKVKDRNSGSETTNEVAGMFVQIGLTPNSAPFKDEIGIDRSGQIIADRNCRTSVTGVYAAGDVTDVAYKQIVIAMGEGAKAALSAFDDRMRGITPTATTN